MDFIHEKLISFGISTALKGFQYLHDAVELVITQPDKINFITKEIYPDVAKVNDTTASRCERAMRHAIECCFERSDLDSLHQYFGNGYSAKKGKPTNGEFISLVALRMTEEYNRRKNKSIPVDAVLTSSTVPSVIPAADIDYHCSVTDCKRCRIDFCANENCMSCMAYIAKFPNRAKNMLAKAEVVNESN